ncbi:MAG: sigma-70 family RNA polymerase sigma factor [Spirochaetales bacterium]|nr:sigma-70 family RNA polymerase sigma factor [Candidatus Physcosoma equi]
MSDFAVTTLNSQLLSLVSSYRKGEEKAFAAILSLLDVDRRKLVNYYKEINARKGSFEDDFDSASQEGLWNAVLSFDEEKGTFRSYARSCMENALRASTKSSFSVIGVKTHVQEEISRINKAESRLLLKGIQNPSLEELSAESGILSLKTLKNALAARDAMKLTALDKVFGDGEGEEDTFLGLLSCEEDSTEETFFRSEEERELYRSHTELSPVDRVILSLTYGLYGYRKCTNKEISRVVKLSEVSIIHHREKALAFLRGAMVQWAS